MSETDLSQHKTNFSKTTMHLEKGMADKIDMIYWSKLRTMKAKISWFLILILSVANLAVHGLLVRGLSRST